MLWKVGPTQAVTSPWDVSQRVRDGDTVEVDAGYYHFGLARAVWTANDLTIRKAPGAATRPQMDAQNHAHNGLGLWTIRGNNIVIEGFELYNCWGGSDSWAGIRDQNTGLLTVRDCVIHDCEQGILTNNTRSQSLVLEHCEFRHCGSSGPGVNPGHHHNVYVGAIGTFVMRGCWSHDVGVPAAIARPWGPVEGGHLVKSRANETRLYANRLTGQLGHNSRAVDIPNGGKAYLIGNLIQSGVNVKNPEMVGFGAEGLSNTGPHELYFVGNTSVNDRSSLERGATTVHVRAQAGTSVFKSINNLFCGGGTLYSATAPTEARANLEISQVSLQDPASFDYRLVAGHRAIDAGVEPGAANGVALAPALEYAHPASTKTRVAVREADVGAHEFAGPRTAARPALVPGTWREVPRSNLSAVAGGQPGEGSGRDGYEGSHGIGSYFAYCGACYDSVRQRYGAIIGGGHAAYMGNEGYMFSDLRETWERLRNRSYPPPPPGPDNYTVNVIAAFPDGTPGARHTYGAQCYVPEIDSGVLFGGYAFWNDGHSDRRIWWFNMNTKAWSLRWGMTPWFAHNGGSAYPVYFRGKVYLVALNRGASEFYRYDPITEAFALLNGQASGGGFHDAGAIDTSRGHYYNIDPVKGALYRYDCATGAKVQVPSTIGGTPGAASMLYDPTADVLVLWHPALQRSILLYDIPGQRWLNLTTQGARYPFQAYRNPAGTGAGSAAEDFPSNRLQIRSDGRYVFATGGATNVFIYEPPWAKNATPFTGPMVTAMAPGSGQPGERLTVSVAGSNFTSAGRTTGLSLGSGITVDGVTYVSPSQITAQVTIAPGTGYGVRDVIATNPDGQSTTLFGGFRVSPPPIMARQLPPSIDRVGPAGQATPNGTPDFHVEIQGLMTNTAIARLRIAGPTTGVWEAPYNGTNWILALDHRGATAHAYFEPFGPPGPFVVTVTYANGGQVSTTTDAAKP